MVFDELGVDVRQALLARWLEGTYSGYPAETSGFLERQRDPFANPVGAALREGLGVMLDAVLAETWEPARLEPALDRLMRIRAVQEASPSRALAFIFELKGHARAELTHGGHGELLGALDERVDELGLAAFDDFVHCREEILRIQVDSIRNRSLKVIERLNAWRENRADRQVAVADNGADRPESSTPDEPESE